MKQKIVFVALMVMALAFVYLRIKQVFFASPAPAPVISTPEPRQQEDSKKYVRVGNVEVQVEIADTLQKQNQGLSGHAPLADKSGMLFMMPTTARHSFWMKDMKFPLDILWIRDNKIIDISDNVPAPIGDELPITVQPKESADAVLEMNSDFTEKYGIKIGDIVEQINTK